jgi:transposase-like protein
MDSIKKLNYLAVENRITREKIYIPCGNNTRVENAMKPILIAVACIFLANCGGAQAQVSSGGQAQRFMRAPSEQLEKGKALFAQYNAQHRNNPTQGRRILDEVYALGLPTTAESVTAIRAALASQVSNEEKVALARILSRLYTPENLTGLNDAIVRDLKGISNSGDRDLARAATLAYSRLGYFADWPDVLLSARTRGVISADTYFGELAHLAPFAPANDQLILLKAIRNAKNIYASEILAMAVNNPETNAKFSPETRAEITALLEETEPNFGQALGHFDYIEADRYSVWLRAFASLKGSAFNKKGAELIMGKLNNDQTDPRKIMAFFTSRYGASVIKDIGERSRFEVILQRISFYSKQHPQNMDMREMVEEFKAMLSNLKG